MAERIFLDIAGAAQAASVSRDVIRKAVNSGALRAKRIGEGENSKRLIRPSDLEKWFDQLGDA